MKETMARYPNADIIDYKHLGRSELSSTETSERFKLWLRDKDGSEFGLHICITFHPGTEILHAMTFERTSR